MRCLGLVVVHLLIQASFAWLTNMAHFFESKATRYFKSRLVKVARKDRSVSLAFPYYLMTSLFAIIVGLVLVNWMQPGVGVDLGLKTQVEMTSNSLVDVLDLFVRMIPVNFFEVASQGQMLPIIFFCVLFGVFLIQLEQSRSQPIVEVVTGLFEVMMRMTRALLYLAPIGIWGLMTKLVATTGFHTFMPLAWYGFCVVIALSIHGAVTLPLLVRFITKKNPFLFMGK